MISEETRKACRSAASAGDRRWMRPIRAHSSLGMGTVDSLVLPLAVLFLLAGTAGLNSPGTLTLTLALTALCAGHAALHAGRIAADEHKIVLQRPLQTPRTIPWDQVQRIRTQVRWWWPFSRFHPVRGIAVGLRSLRIEMKKTPATLLQKPIRTHVITGLSLGSSDEARNLQSEWELQRTASQDDAQDRQQDGRREQAGDPSPQHTADLDNEEADDITELLHAGTREEEGNY